MAEIEMRPATAADEESIRYCIVQAYASVRQEIADLPDVAGGIQEDIERHDVIVAEDGDQFLGVVIFGDANDATMIYNLAVSPEAQGLGIARKLLDVVETTAQGRQHKMLRLKTHRAMQQTRSMYKHLGWTEIGTTGNTVLVEKPVAE